jgi:hypothetical protein
MAEFKINGTLNTTKGVKTKGANYILVSASGTATENATELLAAYTAAQNMSPSSGNRITIVASPGYYEFNSYDFIMNQEYIDIVSLDGNRSIKIIGSYTIGVVNNCYVNGVDTGTLPFKIADGDSRNTVIENCKGGDYSFGYSSQIASTYTIEATFIDCRAGSYSFGAVVSSEEESSLAVAAGTFIRCTANNYSFGSGGQFSNAIASGVFRDCRAIDFSFGSGYESNASGLFMYCESGDGSFGGNPGGDGQITGKLYYCRKTFEKFATVNEPGVIRLSLDGDDDEINVPSKK